MTISVPRLLRFLLSRFLQVYIKELGLSEREEKRLRCLVGSR